MNKHVEINDIKVSVVVPVYNTEKYLEQCLDSIINQTLKEIEIICVDDGSTDSSPEILDSYKSKDARVQVLHQQNMYAGVARNRGLEAATGEYIIFLDADDFFEPTMLEKAYAQAKAVGDADIVLFGVQKYDNPTGRYIDAQYYCRADLLKGMQVFSKKDLPEDFLLVTAPTPWNKLFRRNFVINEGIRFQALPNANDAFFVLVALAVSKAVTWVDEILLYYRVGLEGNIQTVKKKNPTVFFDAYEAVYDELNKRGIYKKVEKSFTATVISGCVFNLDTVGSDEAQIKIYNRLQEPSFTRMGLLDHPDDFYIFKIRAQRLKGAKYIVEWKNILSRMTADHHFHTVLDPREKDTVPCVSVIIPVYNVAPYLKECLDCICNQTLRDIEIICVNDGSTDGSFELLMEYASGDNRIAVFTQENAGLSATRNRGVEQARGKYIYFMDSDDMLELNALEVLYKDAEKRMLDVIYFDATGFADSPEQDYLVESHYGAYYVRSYNYGDIVYSGKELMNLMLHNKEYRTAVWIQFINRDFYMSHGFCFIEGILYEDNPFTYASMILAERVGYLDMQLFHRRVRANSIMTGKASFANTYGYFISHMEMLKFYIEHDLTDMDYLTFPLKDTMNNAIKECMKISMDERQAMYALPDYQRNLFSIYVGDIAKNRDKKNAEIEDILNSRTFKLGSIFMWLPKKIRDIVRDKKA